MSYDAQEEPIFVDLDASESFETPISSIPSTSTVPLTIDEVVFSLGATFPKPLIPNSTKLLPRTIEIEDKRLSSQNEALSKIPLTDTQNETTSPVRTTKDISPTATASLLFVINTQGNGSESVHVVSLTANNTDQTTVNQKTITADSSVNLDAEVLEGVQLSRPKCHRGQQHSLQSPDKGNLRIVDGDGMKSGNDFTCDTVQVAIDQLKRKINGSTFEKHCMSSKILSGLPKIMNAKIQNDVASCSKLGATEDASSTDSEDEMIKILQSADGTFDTTKYPTSGRGPNGTYLCPFCDYTNATRYLLIRHMRTHSSVKPYACDHCSRNFKTINSLRNHHNTHSGAKPHICPTCGSGFATSGEVWRHVRYKHTMERPHQCPHCDYASVEVGKLKRHLCSHNGIKPYQCSYQGCGYAAQDSHGLKRHFRIHTKEKPYQCPECDKSFSQSSSLKAHRQMHRKALNVEQQAHLKMPKICFQCSTTSEDIQSYMAHIKNHARQDDLEIYRFTSNGTSNLNEDILVDCGSTQSQCIKNFFCTSCSSLFRYKFQLHSHFVECHPGSTLQVCYRCHLCSELLSFRTKFKKHMEMHVRREHLVESVVNSVANSCDIADRNVDLTEKVH